MKPKKPSSNIIDPSRFGVSFSLKQCNAFGVHPEEILEWLISVGWRRFRLMSYWNEHEKQPGKYDFTELDRQVSAVEKAGGIITLCLGARQPRWPENHWPEWAWQATKSERSQALLKYIEAVVSRYKDSPAVVNWQLENEALLKSFGRNPEVDRGRLREEYKLIKQLDSSRPIIMTTSNSWGLPILGPIPDVCGFSYYTVMHRNGKYFYTFLRPWVPRIRRMLIKLMWRNPCFIHELQCEPWGPTAIWKMSLEQQNESMSPEHIRNNIRVAKSTGLYPIDLWGAEWWYWRLVRHKDPSIWRSVTSAIEPEK